MNQPDGKTRKRNARAFKRMAWLGNAYHRLSAPLTVFFLFANPRFHPKYGMTWRRKMRLGLRLYRNWRHLTTGISYKAHIAMAAKLFEIPPAVKGAVVECGCWLGGTTANLSIICDVVGRDLIVYDSFEGLPAPLAGDNMRPQAEGTFRGPIDVVKENVRRYGVIERCEFREGWFRDTLQDHTEPIVLCFIDVDLKSSMHDCVVNLWPHLTDEGYLFFDEYTHLHNSRAVLFGAVLARLSRREPAGSHGNRRGRGCRPVLPGSMAGRDTRDPATDESCVYTQRLLRKLGLRSRSGVVATRWARFSLRERSAD